MKTTPATAWIPVTEADKLLNACNDRTSALRDLDDLVARGGVRVWATGITSLYRKQAGSSRQPSGPVQAATWAAVRGGPLEPAMWATGVVTLPATNTATGLVLRGVRLERDTFFTLLEEYKVVPPPVAAAIPQAAACPSAPTMENGDDVGAPGGRRRWKKWDSVWKAIVELALDDRLNRAEFPSQASLIEGIRDMRGEGDIFSDRIMKQFISPVYREFVQPRS